MLSSVGNVLVGLVGLIHVFIFNLESLKWYRGAAKGFGVKKEHYPTTAVFAANQGFYNLILAFGCFYSLLTGELRDKLFFVTAVCAAGIIGFITTGSGKILRAQCFPTILALIALVLGESQSTGDAPINGIAYVAATLAGTVFLSFFVKSRLDGDAKYHATKDQK